MSGNLQPSVPRVVKTIGGSPGPALTCDASSANAFYAVLTGDCAVTVTSPKEGQFYILSVTQDGTGGRALTAGAGMTFVSNAGVAAGLPAPAQAAGAITMYLLFCASVTPSSGAATFSVIGAFGAVQASSVQPPNDVALTLNGGQDTGAGNVSGSFENVLLNTGKMNTTGGAGTNVTAKIAISHPDLGLVCSWSLQGTAGSPDVANYVRQDLLASLPFYVFAPALGSWGVFYNGAARILSDSVQLQLGVAGEIIRVNTVSAGTVGGAGGAAALPATPVEYIRVSINGTTRKIPCYLDV